MSIDLSKMPKLGFGLMRLPEKDGEIDIEHVKRMVDKYMQMDMNYFDTAYVYHGGKSEVAAREALVKRYPRDSFMIATKLPAWEKTVAKAAPAAPIPKTATSSMSATMLITQATATNSRGVLELPIPRMMLPETL